ncbi:lytic transglycosylase [Alsobacter soli]|uniref:Lytic transglycosylase n=1 Tax=Alsobacter soli TaxID=2109933 RepID=A0A2T1HX16_9HYPH|nr:lytic murein transglycosylase [Alsobacter soli]PSC06154.1 lytic transglycosylase [Alsobacter soli]
MKTIPALRAAVLACVALVPFAAPASAATCRDPAGFDKFLDDIRAEARARGVSDRGIEAGLAVAEYDQGIVSRDRGQKVFRQSFEEFSARMVSKYRLSKGQSLLRQMAPTFARIEQQFGVPGPVLVAIWGLETDFGAVKGNFGSLRALASLAYDCRRSEMFQNELIDALKIIDRGDMTAAEMHGAWAGEFGQTQFMPSSFLKFAVDFDGDGRRDLIRSSADALASTANFLHSYGWQRGQPWGPGTANFDVILQWNKSQVYSRTIAYYAERLAGRDTVGSQ